MQKSSSSPTVERLADLVAYQPGSVVSRVLLKKETGNVTLFAFGRGEELSEHTVPFDALVTLVDGKAEITIGSDAFPIEAGETITLPANVPHAVRAVEDFKMMLVMLRNRGKSSQL
jgi:quercetin dioxygenase-like cupin family protein